MLTCLQFHEQVLEWAVGALPREDEEVMEQHLRTETAHDGCREAAAQAFDAAALLAASLPPERPDPAIWASIEARLRLPDARADDLPRTAAQRPRRRREIVGWVVAVAAVIALILLGRKVLRTSAELAATRRDLATAHHQAALRRECERDLDAMRARFDRQESAVALLRTPGTQVVPLAAQGKSAMAANAILNSHSDKGYVLVGGARPPSGKDLELWVIRGKHKLPAGLLHPDAHGRALHPIAGKLLTDGLPDALAVTVEPKGGSRSPTGPIVLVGKPRKI